MTNDFKVRLHKAVEQQAALAEGTRDFLNAFAAETQKLTATLKSYVEGSRFFKTNSIQTQVQLSSANGEAIVSSIVTVMIQQGGITLQLIPTVIVVPSGPSGGLPALVLANNRNLPIKIEPVLYFNYEERKLVYRTGSSPDWYLKKEFGHLTEEDLENFVYRVFVIN